MADAQITNPAVADGESLYEVKGGVEFTLKAVNADFMDNGAAADWLPTVVIASDSGHVIARACDQAVKVTGGDDAAVSWFPGVKPTSRGAASTLDLPWCYAEGNMGMNGSNLSYFDFATNSPTTYDQPGPPNLDVRILEQGTYLLFFYSEWTTLTGVPAVGTRVRLGQNITYSGAGGSERDVHDGELGVGSLDASGIANHFVWQTHGLLIVNVQAATPPAAIRLGAQNTAGSTKTSDDTAVTVVRVAATPFAGSL